MNDDLLRLMQWEQSFYERRERNLRRWAAELAVAMLPVAQRVIREDAAANRGRTMEHARR